MSDWIPLDRTALLEPRNEIVGGVETEVADSPRDLPVALRVEHEPAAGKTAIEFRYVGSAESTKRVKFGELALMVGRESGRIMRIEARTEETSEQKALEELVNRVSELMQQPEVERFRRRSLFRPSAGFFADHARIAWEAIRRSPVYAH